MIENTLSIIKPDAVERNLENEIKEMFKGNGFTILKENKIEQTLYDEFLTTDEMSKIQEVSYELSNWYSKEQLSNYLLYNDYYI